MPQKNIFRQLRIVNNYSFFVIIFFMKIKKEDIRDYALKLLKKKNYFIGEFYQKLIIKYDRKSVSRIIKEFIILELINDKYLTEMKICYFIHIKMYGKKYIENYFENRNISLNLVRYVLSKYSIEMYLKNIDEIRNNLYKKGKNDNYINNYLLRKGYSEEEIKRYVS